MKILVIGSGGREHAIVWKTAQSPRVRKIFCAPGNPGTASFAENIPIKSEDINGLLNFARENKIDLTIVGTESPLVLGIVDEFQKNNLMVFGPSKSAAQLEGSKIFAKNIMKKFNVPTAGFSVFIDAHSALEYIKEKEFPQVIKADGLAAGKGVLIVNSFEEAEDAVQKIIINKSFGEAGSKIVVEEFLEGQEASILAVSDGNNFIILPSAQDHKAVFDNDRGPNTGGMGAYSPAPMVTEEIFAEVKDKVFTPIIRGMASLDMPYKGVLYAGLMLTKNGLKVLEFNCRLGDPEAQAILPRIKTDLIEIIDAAVNNKLENYKIEIDNRACVCVVLASGGYPEEFKKGYEISGLDAAANLENVVIFHAGTQFQSQIDSDGRRIVTSGGRVLGVTALGDTIEEAIDQSYNAVSKIHFENMHYRSDIGAKALSRRIY